MVIFINEERLYSSWRVRHRQGFVLDGLRKPTRKTPVIHRALCQELKDSRKNTHWTTGRHLKACSLDLDELNAWAKEQWGDEPLFCTNCRPDDATDARAPTVDSAVHDHLTKLGKEIVDCVLDVAVACLDDRETGYALTVGDVANLLGKTPAQMTAALLRLIEDKYLAMEGPPRSGAALAVDRTIYPTAKALRTLPAFRFMKAQDLDEELYGLYATRT